MNTRNVPEHPATMSDALVVLIVDDVPDNVAPLHDALDEAGYTVLVALDGEAALRRAAQALPDVILLDALMPGLDGFEVARRLTFRLHQQVGDQEGEAGEGGDWLIVMQETSDASVLEAIAHAFGLTAREAEVLYWVAKGKINRDIGDILGASPATVKKHLERIYAKLGVETRTAAAAMAINRVPLLQPRHGA
jgi:DNA-binding NarL/FixJ family response regulator